MNVGAAALFNNMENRILETRLVNWRELKDLQPKNAKIKANTDALKDTLTRYGFSVPFYGWQDKDGQIHVIDGHTRKEVLKQFHDAPEMLPCTLIKAKNKKHAMEILIEVFNQNQNPFDAVVLEAWIQAEELIVKVEDVNIDITEVEQSFEQNESSNEPYKEDTNMIAVTLTEDEHEQWVSCKEKLGKMRDKNAIFELIRIYETNIT